eukprot:scaffold51550_cov55-Attheya_sp.AAC.2
MNKTRLSRRKTSPRSDTKGGKSDHSTAGGCPGGATTSSTGSNSSANSSSVHPNHHTKSSSFFSSSSRRKRSSKRHSKQPSLLSSSVSYISLLVPSVGSSTNTSNRTQQQEQHPTSPPSSSLAMHRMTESVRRHVELTFAKQHSSSLSTSSSSSSSSGVIPEQQDETSQSLQKVARDCMGEQRFDEAMAIYRTLLTSQTTASRSSSAIYKTITSPSSLDEAVIRHNLAVLHVIQGDYQGALPLIQESLLIRRTKTGNKRMIGGSSSSSSSSHKQQLQDDEFEIMMGLSELGVVYYGLGEFGAALQVWREALQMSCQALGYEHYEVARLLNNIGCLHFETGKLVAALATFEESLDIAQRTLGKRSPQHADMALLNVATTLCNVGMVSIRRNQYDAAIALLEEGLMVQESVLDDDHITAQTTSQTLSLLQQLQTEHSPTSDNNNTTININNTSLNQLDTLQMLEEKLGNNTSTKNTMSDTNTESTCATTTNSMDDGATTVHDKIDWIELGPLRRELSLRQRIRATVLKDFCFEPLDTSYDSENVHLLMKKALQHLKSGIVEPALELLDQVLKRHVERYGEVHSLVGTAQHNKGLAYMYAEDYAKALPCFQKAVDIRRASLGVDHFDVSASLMKKGMVLLAHQDLDGAHVTFHQVLRTRRKAVGCNHLQIAKILNMIGYVHYESGGLLAARKAMEEGLEIQREQNSQGLATCLCNLAFVHVKRREYAEGICKLEEAMKLQKSLVGSSHPLTVSTLENLSYAMAAANAGNSDNEDTIPQVRTH